MSLKDEIARKRAEEKRERTIIVINNGYGSNTSHQHNNRHNNRHGDKNDDRNDDRNR